MKRPLSWLLVALLLIVALGVQGLRSGWFSQDYTAAELTALERDWNTVVSWARLPAATESPDTRLVDLAREWDAAGISKRAVAGRGSGASSPVARADLPEDERELLQRFEALLAEEHLDTFDREAAQPVMALLDMGKLALQMDDLDAERMGQFLRLTRSMHRQRSLILFMVGTALADNALDRCLADERLIPEPMPGEPAADEYFTVLCRDYVLMQQELTLGGFMPPAGELKLLGYSVDNGAFVEQSMKRAITTITHRLHPLRHDPARFSSVMPNEKPGAVKLWLAATFHLPGIFSQSLETEMLQPNQGAAWMRLIAKWRRVAEL